MYLFLSCCYRYVWLKSIAKHIGINKKMKFCRSNRVNLKKFATLTKNIIYCWKYVPEYCNVRYSVCNRNNMVEAKKLSNSTFKQHFFEWNCLDNGSLYLTTNETATKNQNKHWKRHSRPLVPLPQIITSWSQRVKSMRRNQLHLKKTVGFSTLELM